MMPVVLYTLSHQLVPILREYCRTSATAIDASLNPLIQAHLRGMAEDLAAVSLCGDLLVSTSAGGCQHVEKLLARPIHTLKSRPVLSACGMQNNVLEGWESRQKVRDVDGVVFTGEIGDETLAVDEAATAALRREKAKHHAA
jgi:N-methylhydantoinase A